MSEASTDALAITYLASGGERSWPAKFPLVNGKGEGREAMNTVIRRTKSFLVSEDGPTATEYAVMLALIILASVTAITGLGTKVGEVFWTMAGEIDAAGAGTT